MSTNSYKEDKTMLNPEHITNEESNQGNFLLVACLVVFLGSITGLVALNYAPNPEAEKIRACVETGVMQYVDGNCVPIGD